MLRVPGPLGSIDRNEPSDPTSRACGAPKFDRLPTRIRFSSSIAPGRVNEGKRVGVGLAQAAGSLRNLPTCEMADAPGMFVATTRAFIWVIACARVACHAAPPSEMAIPAANAIVPDRLAMSLRTFIL